MVEVENDQQPGASLDPPVPSEVLNRRESLEQLLQQLYNPCLNLFGIISTTYESESYTDQSSEPSAYHGQRIGYEGQLTKQKLEEMDTVELRKLVGQLKHEVHTVSQCLVRALRRRNPHISRQQSLCNLLSAVLQAYSPKRSEDSKLKFSLRPMPGEDSYQQWLDSMRAVARLPGGMPQHFRRKLWLTLADNYVQKSGIDWQDVRTRCFSEKLNPDDNELTMQIVKDLHRTGWSGFSSDKERVLLKRVLLAYARYNKAIGYCQGFNVIAALIMEVMENKEDQALKVMIMLVEHVLPSGYFDQTLRALSVDMTVLKDLMALRLPALYSHLEALQKSSDCEYEPPLMNVFSMQWFLTIFATIFPKHLVFRIWDSLMLEGSEILLRVALAIFAKICRQSLAANSADAFYELMSVVTRRLQRLGRTQSESLMRLVYSMAEFPFPGLDELRDRHLWNIQPFSSGFSLFRQQVISILKTESDLEAGDEEATKEKSKNKKKTDEHSLSELRKQYKQIKERQKQTKLFMEEGLLNRPRTSVSEVPPNISDVFNHLFLSNRQNNQVSIPKKPLSESVTVAPCMVQPKSTQQPQNRQRRTRPSGSQSSDHPPESWISCNADHQSLSVGSPNSFDWVLSISRRQSLLGTQMSQRFRSEPCVMEQYRNSSPTILRRSISCMQLTFDHSPSASPVRTDKKTNVLPEETQRTSRHTSNSSKSDTVTTACSSQAISPVHKRKNKGRPDPGRRRSSAQLRRSRAIIEAVSERKAQNLLDKQPVQLRRSAQIARNGKRYGLYA